MGIRVPVLKLPAYDYAGNARINAKGNQIFSGDAKSGGIRFSKDDITNIKMNMDSLLPGTIEQIAENMKRQASMILENARDGTAAQRKWKDHPNRHRGLGAEIDFGGDGRQRRRRAGANSKWPHNLTAREGLFTYVRARKTFVELGLSHDPQTVFISKGGRKYNYGQALETLHAGRYAVIGPTLHAAGGGVMTACNKALKTPALVQKKGSSGGSGSVIASGWFKQ